MAITKKKKIVIGVISIALICLTIWYFSRDLIRYDENTVVRVYYNYFDWNLGAHSRQELLVEKNDVKTLIDEVNKYKNAISTNVIKSIFMNSYIVEINNESFIEIDAEADNYAGNETYMFVFLKGYKYIKGCYIDSSILDILENLKK